MNKLNYKYKSIILYSDSEYGTNVYFKHSYLDIEFSYWTEEECLPNILKELNYKVEKKEEELKKD